MRAAVILAVTAAALVVAPAGAEVDPDILQARYDAARDRVEGQLAKAKPNAAALRRARAELAVVEAADFRPRGWRGAHDVPRTALPRTAHRARAARATDVRVARELASIGKSYRGWAAFWIHDLSTGETAGWNSDARFPAASLVKLGAYAAGLRRAPRPERSPYWYDLRQLAGWSSNLAANRLTARLGYPATYDALRRLGMRRSTYPGPYRAGTAVADAPKPPPLTHVRLTTARDLGRALYAFQAAARGNRYVQHTSGLSAHQARLGLELLLDSSRARDNAGVVAPFVGRAPVAQKNGWISDFRGTAAIVYHPGGPKIVVVLAYRPGITLAEAQRLGRAAVRAAG